MRKPSAGSRCLVVVLATALSLPLGGCWIERAFLRILPGYNHAHGSGFVLLLAFLLSDEEDWSAVSSVPTAGAALATPKAPLFVPGAAHLGGSLGTNWRSDLAVHNPGSVPATFALELLLHDQANTSPARQVMTLAPGESVRLGDVMATTFATDGKATLRLLTVAGRVLVTSRTYNLLGAGNPNLPAGSTFGQFVPAFPDGDAITDSGEGRLIQLRHDTGSTGFRTNLGLVNTTPSAIDVEVALHRADGTRLGTVPVQLEAFEYLQVDRIFGKVTSSALADGYAVVRTTTAGGRFLAYASVADNVSGDPITVSAMRPGSGTRTLYVQSAAHLAGAGGTNWRTDLEVHNPGTATVRYRVDFLDHDADNSHPASRSFTLAAGRSERFDDVLAGVFGISGKGSLRIVPESGELLATSRTYNLLGAGNALGYPAGTTFGQFIPAEAEADGVGYGEEGRLIQLAHDPSGVAGFRTNLAFQNLAGAAVDVSVELHRGDGARLGTVVEHLKPYAYLQHGKIFEAVTSSVVQDGYAVVSTATPGARFLAQASVVDNRTGDPVAMAALGSVGTSPAPSVEELASTALRLLSPSSPGEEIDLEKVVATAQQLGVGPILDAIASAHADVATRTASGLVHDFGSRYVTGSGAVLSGREVLTVDHWSSTASRLDAALTAATTDLRADGRPPLLDRVSWTAALDISGNGTVRGQLTVSGGASTSGARTAAAASSLTGSVQIDTALCKYYPVAGTITFSADGQVVTLTFDGSCDGSVKTSSNNSAQFFAAGSHTSTTYGAFFVTVDGAATGTGTLTVKGPTLPRPGNYAFEVEAGGSGAVAVTLELTSEPSRLEGDYPVDWGGGNVTATYALTGSEHFLPPSTYTDRSVHTFVLPGGQSEASFTAAVLWEGAATYYDAAGHPFQTAGLQFSMGRADVHIVRR